MDRLVNRLDLSVSQEISKGDPMYSVSEIKAKLMSITRNVEGERLSARAMADDDLEIAMATMGFQEKPYTAILVIAIWNETVAVAPGFSKVCYPDEFDMELGLEIAITRAVRAAAEMLHHKLYKSDENLPCGTSVGMMPVTIDATIDFLEMLLCDGAGKARHESFQDESAHVKEAIDVLEMLYELESVGAASIIRT